MGLFDWLRPKGQSAAQTARGKLIRTWGVSLEDGRNFGAYEVYSILGGYQVLSTKGLAPGEYCKAQSANGVYPDLKAALHGTLCELSDLVIIVFLSKLEALNKKEEWKPTNPRQLIIFDATWIDTAKGVFALGKVFLDDERLEVVEVFMADPDTSINYPQALCRVLADTNG